MHTVIDPTVEGVLNADGAVFTSVREEMFTVMLLDAVSKKLGWDWV